MTYIIHHPPNVIHLSTIDKFSRLYALREIVQSYEKHIVWEIVAMASRRQNNTT